MEANCWVNVFRALYSNPEKGLLYYVSFGYPTKEQAIAALNGPKAKSIMHRYITTTNLNFEINMKTINEHVQIFNTLDDAMRYFDHFIVSGGKSGRLLTTVTESLFGGGDYFVDTTPKPEEQLHIVHPDKYVVLKNCKKVLSRVSTNNTCLTCKFWGGKYNTADGIADCGHIGIDSPKSFRKPGTKEGAYINVRTDDDQGLTVDFVTRATFSCSDHQPKTK